MSKLAFISSILLLLAATLGCREKKAITVEEVSFTKEDSLTDRYLSLQDSLLQAWNMMMNDDNQKLKSLHHLLHELSVGKQANDEKLQALNLRLEQLMRIRFTPKTMGNPDVVEEYDFASNSLTAEVVSLATSAPNFEQNTTIQSLVQNIQQADAHMLDYRYEYDLIAAKYNDFLQQNRAMMKSIDANSSLEKRALFDMMAEED